MRTTTRKVTAVAFILAIAAILVCGFYRRFVPASHPAIAAFQPGRAQDWTPYGGSWKIFNDSIQNDSEERGAKLMNGSPDWSDYAVEADIQILGPYGDAGILLRSSGEEEGVDSYHGYYALLRNMNDTLTIGRADYGLDQFVTEPIIPQIGQQEWFHLKFVAYDCDLAAEAISSSSNTRTYAAAHDPRCIHEGRFGLRSFSTSARWKNIHLHAATRKDLEEITGHTTIENITYSPDWVRNAVHFPPVDRYMAPIHREAERLRSDAHIESIDHLALMNLYDQHVVTIHGVVTLAAPELYIQDGTGGIRAPDAILTGPVKAGDQVEAHGTVVSTEVHPVLKHATIRVLSSNVPIPALTATAFELAVGNHEDQLVEVEGILQDSFRTDKRLTLQLSEGSQQFYAIADPGDLSFSNLKLQNGSRLRLRGVETKHIGYTGNRVAFAILMPTASSVAVIEGPSWWSRRHIAILGIVIVILILMLFTFSRRLQNWRIASVLDERERLALEMHDTLAQSFAGIGFQLQAILQETKGSAAAANQVQIALTMVRSSHEEAKRSIAALRPRFLNNADLVDNLRQAAERLVEGEHVTIVTHTEGPVDQIPLRISDALFRIGQEAISNAIRHSHARTITISLSLLANRIRLSVRDDGIGFDMHQNGPGFGIRGMTRRSDNIGGRIQIISAPNHGTAITITADLAPRSSAFERLRSVARFIMGV
jgi:signal transduction histidine kinase